MRPEDEFRRPDSLLLGIAISLLVHGLVLFAPLREKPSNGRPAARLEARLAPQPTETRPTPPATPAPATRPRENKRLLAVDKGKSRPVPQAPRWSTAQREEMNRFLDDLATEPRNRPSLAQRSLAMARQEGLRRPAEAEDGEMLERLPNSPPVDPFSLEMYLDALVKKLNRSAAYVKNDPRSKGMHTAAVQVRLNPDGSLQSFRILNAGDQQEEIAFIRSVVERAVPFAAFPADLRGSARSLAMVICILPSNASGGGFGFSRLPNGRNC